MRRGVRWSAVGAWLALSGPAAAWTWIDTPAWKLDLTGNWQYDSGRVSVQGRSSDTAHQWRRQRLGAQLKGQRADVLVEYDLQAREWTDVHVRIRGVAGGELLVGQFKQPFGLEELTSDKRTLLQESSLAGGFVLGRRAGLGWVWNPADLGVQVGVFDRNLNGVPGSRGAAARGWWTVTPVDDLRLHVGAALALEAPQDDAFGLSARADTRLRDLRLARSGTLRDVDAVQRFALEGLVQQGSVWLQGEWLWTQARRQTAADYRAQAGYVQAGWISGGAQRGYKQGVVQQVDRASVLELGLRWSAVDLQDAGVAGGRAQGLGAVATWYVQPETRISLEHGRLDARDPGTPDVNLTQLRLQFVF